MRKKYKTQLKYANDSYDVEFYRNTVNQEIKIISAIINKGKYKDYSLALECMTKLAMDKLKNLILKSEYKEIGK